MTISISIHPPATYIAAEVRPMKELRGTYTNKSIFFHGLVSHIFAHDDI